MDSWILLSFSSKIFMSKIFYDLGYCQLISACLACPICPPPPPPLVMIFCYLWYRLIHPTGLSAYPLNIAYILNSWAPMEGYLLMKRIHNWAALFELLCFCLWKKLDLLGFQCSLGPTVCLHIIQAPACLHQLCQDECLHVLSLSVLLLVKRY